MARESREVTVREDEIREFLTILENLFGIKAGYFHRSENGRWTVILNRKEHYGAFCKLVREGGRSDKCEASNDDFLAKAQALGKPLWYQCYNGLFELYVPLKLDAQDGGFLHLPQMRSEKPFSAVVRECHLENLPNLDKVEAAYGMAPRFTDGQREAMATLVGQFADRIQNRRLVQLRRANPIRVLEQYIAEQGLKEPSVAGAAVFAGKSVSWVTHTWNRYHHESFRGAIHKMRMEKGAELLAHHSIAETSVLCGFKNRYHFTRIFSKYFGEGPLAFQKKIKQKAEVALVKREIESG